MPGAVPCCSMLLQSCTMVPHTPCVSIRYNAQLRRLPSGANEWSAALGRGLAALTSLRRLRLVLGGLPEDGDLAPLAPLLGAPTVQLQTLELQLHGSWGGGWGGDAARHAWGAGGGAPGGGEPACRSSRLTPGGVAFLAPVPELALLLPGDMDCLGPLAALLALPNMQHVELVRASVLAPCTVAPLAGCRALQTLHFQVRS